MDLKRLTNYLFSINVQVCSEVNDAADDEDDSSASSVIVCSSMIK